MADPAITYAPARGAPDWYVVPGSVIWEKLRMKPLDVAGVRPRPNGASLAKPWPYEVHRTHLPLLGIELPTETAKRYPEVLRPYQRITYDYVRARRGSLVGDEQRVGKTVPVLYALDDDDTDPMLVVGPTAARLPWHEWAARRFGACVVQHEYVAKKRRRECPICARVGATLIDGEPSFHVLEGRTYDVETLERYRPRVLFCTFAVVSTWRQLFAKYRRISQLAIDEAHLAGVQNRKSQTVESLRWLNSVAERVIPITGTPLYNKVKGLWPLFDLAAPASFGGFWDFARRYCAARPGAHGWTAEGETHADELRARMSEIMLRRTWRDVQSDLPPMTRTLEMVPLPQAVKDKVEEAAATVRFETRSAKTFVGDLARLRKMYAKEKTAHALEKIRELLNEGHSVVAWAWHTDVADTIFERLSGAGIPVYGPIYGATSAGTRERALSEAERDTRPRVIVANILSLSTAISLAWAPVEVFVELDWVPVNIAQAEMRIVDGKRPKQAIYLVADVEADERLAHALIHKLETQDKLGLKAGMGDVADVLADSLGVDRGRSLDDLARAVLETAGDYV
jgi:hypothetical protein